VTTLPALVAEQVRLRPEAPAVVAEDGALGYGELGRRAARLAGRLRALGVGPETVVPVCLERSTDLAVGLLGVLAAGAAYLPLDPDHPPARLALQVQEARAPVLLAQRRLARRLPAFAGTTCWIEEAGGDEADLAGPARPGHLAYVIYTSGSTGRPKGVMVTHAAIANRLRWMQDAHPLTAGDRVLQKTPLTFDVSLWELFWPLLAGAVMVMARPGGHRDRAYLAGAIQRHGVTTIHFVPSLLADFLEEPSARECRSLRRVFSSGEALPADLARRCLATLDAELHNLYGPTEAAVDVTWWPCRRDAAAAALPIGRPIANVRAHVLDADLRPVPEGGSGELWLGGVQLARGYLARPDLTAERFLPDPFGEPGERLYRTGDEARWRTDGALEYLGRLDQQVKLRGVRIELGEIESALRAHPAVADAAAAVRGDRLVAYVVGRRPAGDDELRAFLGERLPESMVPATFVSLPELPLTGSGKLDRGALPEPSPLPPTPAPATPRERALAETMRELLGTEEVGVDDDFFALGGHSLLAARLAARAGVPLDAVFRLRTTRRLAGEPERVEAGPRPQEGVGPGPLTLAQERIWFLQALHPEMRAYHNRALVRLRGRLDVEALRRALAEVVRRHEVLRTTFPEREGRPAQVVHEPPPLRLPVRETAPEALDRVVAAELRRPFDLDRLPLVRWTLLRLGPDDHALLHVDHHLVLDGWSFGILLTEVAHLYRAFATGLPPHLAAPALRLTDFARWQREWLRTPGAAGQAAHWRERLAGLDGTLRLPADRRRPPVERFVGRAPRVDVPSPLCDALGTLGRDQGTTLFTTMLAAFGALLGRTGAVDEVAVGSAFAGRRWPELEGVLGMVASTVVLRLDLAGDPTFRELLARTRDVVVAALANQDHPLTDVVRELGSHRDRSRNPLFQAMFSFDDQVPPSLGLPDLEATVIDALDNGSAKMDLNVVAVARSGGGLTLVWEHSTDLLDETSGRRLAGQYLALLRSAVADPGGRVSELSLGEAPRAAVPPRLPTWCLHERVEAQARRRPSAPALTFDGATLTYAELNARANRLAHRLRGLGVGPEDVVGVCLERSPDLVAAALAVLKAGAAYLPLEPDLPPARRHQLAEDAGARLVLTAGDLDRLAAEPSSDPGLPCRPDAAAYVIFTSGSTGRPKGVVVSHANVSRLLEGARQVLPCVDTDVWTLFHSFAFDFSVWETWGALTSGGRLVMVPRWVARSPESFRRLLLDEGVTVLSQTPSAFRQLVEVDERMAGTGRWRLRLVVLGGEALGPAGLEPWMRMHGTERPALVNMYGITETTVHVTSLRLDERTIREAPGSPIGRPLPDLRVHVLDPALRPLPPGVAGELYVAGPGLARGYLGRPDLTAERFLPDPWGEPGARMYRSGDVGRLLPDGGLEHLGRGDRQVKVRGHRVELGEVEAALAGHPRVAEAAAFVDEDGELTACVAADGPALTVRELRAHLGERLPEYMLPAAFVAVDRLPLTPNGKLDRRALPGLAHARLATGTAFVPPATPTEVALARIWSEVLARETVGADDDFFELGGHSLAATSVAARVRAQLGVALPVSAFFETPTLTAVAAIIDARRL
jgi:amino acid adenylation domain-containing protein